MLNAIGLQNPGIEYFLEHDLPFLKQYNTAIIVNAIGHTVEDYIEVCKVLNNANVDGVELNLSCPNVKEGCLAFGISYDGIKAITTEVRKILTNKPLIVKLSPNVTDITITAKAAEDAGADAVSLINTITAMSIDIDKRRPVLANNTGGLSGPAIKPIAVRMVYQVAQDVKIPILGMGGVITGSDAVEFMLAGANAVSIGCGNFIKPDCSLEVISGIEDYMKKHGFNELSDFVGTLQMN